MFFSLVQSLISVRLFAAMWQRQEIRLANCALHPKENNDCSRSKSLSALVNTSRDDVSLISQSKHSVLFSGLSSAVAVAKQVARIMIAQYNTILVPCLANGKTYTVTRP